MPQETACQVQGCANRAHAKGYCRKHYGQIWRRGKTDARAEEQAPPVAEEPPPRDDTDRMRALERELRRAETMYHNVIGFEGRLKWRREIEDVRREMKRLGMEVPAGQSAVPSPVAQLISL